MNRSSTTSPADATPRAVIAWRRERLVAAGFDRVSAGRLAGDPRHEVVALIQLVERGCPPALAERILAPLD